MKSNTIRLNITLIFSMIFFFSCTSQEYSKAIPAEGYVSVESDGFAIDGKPWFPIMLNYKAYIRTVDGREEVVPADWYSQGDMQSHFDSIRSWGFNSIRVCLDADDMKEDTAAMYEATERMVDKAEKAGLRLMLLLRPPFKKPWKEYTAGLLRRLADRPTVWAYDFMNEPLYFDQVQHRSKESAVRQTIEWRKMVRQNAPHQLFTVATAEPIEVFVWDPSMLEVDFLEMHTYHPLRVQSEMYWYSHYCGKPWMVGETGLPADDEQVPYEAQRRFLRETFDYALSCGAAGYGWWEFQDHLNGVNFEAQYTGLRDKEGKRKEAVEEVSLLEERWAKGEWKKTEEVPANYSNMLAYRNVAACGRVVDKKGRPIEGAVVRGWNNDWSVGMNTFTDAEGRFRLVSNAPCTHFQVSAPGCSIEKFDKWLEYSKTEKMTDLDREYQQIPLLGWGDDEHILPTDRKKYEVSTAVEASMGDIELRRL